LHNPTSSGSGDASEVHTVDAANRLAEVRMVEHVERFDSHLERPALCELGVFLETHVEVSDPRTVQGVTGSVAEFPECYSGGTTCDNAAKTAGIEKVAVLAVKRGSFRIQDGNSGRHLVRIVRTRVEAERVTGQRPETGVEEVHREAA